MRNCERVLSVDDGTAIYPLPRREEARGIVTVHAGSREEPGFDTGILPFNVRDQFDPVDGSTLFRFLGADDGNIVFRLTGDDTGLAGRASVQVDDHAPPGSVSSVVSVTSFLFHCR